MNAILSDVLISENGKDVYLLVFACYHDEYLLLFGFNFYFSRFFLFFKTFLIDCEASILIFYGSIRVSSLCNFPFPVSITLKFPPTINQFLLLDISTFPAKNFKFNNFSILHRKI